MLGGQLIFPTRRNSNLLTPVTSIRLHLNTKEILAVGFTIQIKIKVEVQTSNLEQLFTLP